MKWAPISLDALLARINEEAPHCPPHLRITFDEIRIQPEKWSLSPWGDQGGGFWAVAVRNDRVLWFNDIEDGFQVSLFEIRGRIPVEQYRCNDDQLDIALSKFTSPKFLDEGVGAPRDLT